MKRIQQISKSLIGVFLSIVVVWAGLIGAQSAGATVTSVAANYPYDTVLSPDGAKLYATGYIDDVVTVIDTTANTVLTTIAVGQTPSGIAISSDGSRLYVCNVTDGTLQVINTATNAVLSTSTSTSSQLRDVALSTDGQFVYAAGLGSIYKFNAVTNTLVNTIATATPRLDRLVVSPDGSKLYATAPSVDKVIVVDLASDTVVTNISVGDADQGIVITPDGSKLFTANQLSSNVTVVSTATNTVIATVAANFQNSGTTYPLEPIGITINPQGTQVFVLGTIGRRATVIDVATMTVSPYAPIYVGGGTPYSGSVSPDGKVLYVGCVDAVVAGGQAVYAIPLAQFGSNAAPNASVGTLYSFNPNASNVVSYSLLSGALPPGLTLNSGTGVISGTPTQAGTYSFTLQGSGDFSSSQAYQIQVDAALAKTGFNMSAMLLSTSLLLLGGMLLLVFRARRN